MKKFIKLTVFIIWLGVIFFFSAQTGTESAGLSIKILRSTANAINSIIPIDSDKFILDFYLFVRKFAHFSEYFILFILTYELFKETKSEHVVILSLIFVVVYALSDEFHQTFVADRFGSLIDVLVDSFGAFVSFIFWHLILKR